MPDPTPYPLDQLAERGDAQAPALVLRDRTLSFEELRNRVALLAGWLAGRAGKGARVASWAAKGELTCLLPLAAARAGLVHVPINPLLKRAQVAQHQRRRLCIPALGQLIERIGRGIRH